MEKRNEWMDVAKGIAIILMVLGHTSIPGVLGHFISAFHMPLFFMASGWCTNWNKYSVGSLFTHRLKTLGLPYLIYSCIVIVINEFAEVFYEGSTSAILESGWGGGGLMVRPGIVLCLCVGKSYPWI